MSTKLGISPPANGGFTGKIMYEWWITGTIQEGFKNNPPSTSINDLLPQPIWLNT